MNLLFFTFIYVLRYEAHVFFHLLGPTWSFLCLADLNQFIHQTPFKICFKLCLLLTLPHSPPQASFHLSILVSAFASASIGKSFHLFPIFSLPFWWTCMTIQLGWYILLKGVIKFWIMCCSLLFVAEVPHFVIFIRKLNSLKFKLDSIYCVIYGLVHSFFFSWLFDEAKHVWELLSLEKFKRKKQFICKYEHIFDWSLMKRFKILQVWVLNNKL